MNDDSKELLDRIAQLEEENKELHSTVDSMRSFIREGMGPYVTYEVMDQILAQGGDTTIKAERRRVTMMFTDLRGSTELSERMDANDYIRMLNHYYKYMIEIIDSWEGNITSFVGDAIVVVFGAPRVNEFSALQAVGSAVAMQRNMDAVNEWNRENGYPDLRMGIGIHTGDAVLGCIGSHTRMKYDMIGRNVNLAARIEGFTKGGQILISTSTLEEAGDTVVVRPEGSMRVHPKGIRGEVLLHEVIGFGSYRLHTSSTSGRAEEKEEGQA